MSPLYLAAMYENWRWETEFSAPNFWSVFFYCPSPTLAACNLVNEHLEEQTAYAYYDVALKMQVLEALINYE